MLPHEYQDKLDRYNELKEIKLTRHLSDKEDEEYEDLYLEILNDNE